MDFEEWWKATFLEYHRMFPLISHWGSVREIAREAWESSEAHRNSAKQPIAVDLPVQVKSIPCPECGGTDFYCAECLEKAND